jgi:colicin import membrane protein
MNTDNSYKWSLSLALMLHVALFIFLFAKFTSHNNYALNNSSINIVKAVMVNNPQTHKSIEPKKPEPQNQQNEQLAQQQKLAEQTELLKQRQIQEQKRIAIKQKQEKEKTLALEKQKQIEITKLKAKQELEKKQAKMHDLIQKTMQEQLAAEQQQLAATAESAQIQGELDKYKALIIQSIAQYWIVPDNVDVGIYCQLLVHLAPGGEVLSIKLIRSSGNEILDRSAKTAVLKASPLPVPKESSLFDNFRELTLTVRPEGVVAG